MKFFAEACTVTYFNTSKSSRQTSRPGKAGSYKLNSLLFIKLRMLPLIPWLGGEAALSLR
jgi:hypothetical protein